MRAASFARTHHMHSSIAEQRRVADAILRATLCVKAARVELALAELHELPTKANFNANQPRVPAGNPDGGQWTDDPQWTGVAPGINHPRVLSDAAPSNEWKPGGQYAQYRPPTRRQFPNATLGQQARLAAVQLRESSAIRRVKEIDPNWEPRVASAYAPNSIEGATRHIEARAEAAEARLRELGRLPPEQLIDAFAKANTARDLFGRQTWPKPKSAIAVTTIDGQPVFGVHSRAPSHLRTSADKAMAQREVHALMESGRLGLPPRNSGQMPLDSLYHAEANVLLRAAAMNGGSLAGRRLEVRVNQKICDSCLEVLPSLGLRLGNPVVIFIDRTGVSRTMWNGKWQ
jgi:hypothetical protein